MTFRWELHVRRLLCGVERLWRGVARGRTRQDRLEAFGLLMGSAAMAVGLIGMIVFFVVSALCALLWVLAPLLPYLLLGMLMAFGLALLEWFRTL